MASLGEKVEKGLKWAGGVLTFLGVLSTLVGIWIYLDRDQRQSDEWLDADRSWNAEILGRLEAMEVVASVQGQQLRDLMSTVEVSETRRNTDMEELEEEHSEILEAIYAMEARMAYRLGVEVGARR